VTTVDFGLLFEIGVPKPWDDRSEYRAYWNGLEQAKVAEEAGFSHIWAVEHHFLEEFSHCSAPEIWLTAVAQHTSRIRIGHGVVLVPPPFNHPVRVAERVAALDILSNGRVEFGAGRSITREELGGFNIDSGDSRPMLLEGLEQIVSIWTRGEEPAALDGTYTTMPPRPVFPRPLQRPHPPLWMASTSPDTYELAGRHGCGVLAFGWAIDPPALKRQIDRYRSTLHSTDHGDRPVNDRVAVFLMGLCREDEQEAKERAREPFTYYMDASAEFFLQWGRGGTMPPGYEWYAEASQHTEAVATRKKFDYLVDNGMALVGRPETVIDVIETYRAAGADQIIVGSQLGAMAHEDVVRSLRLMGDRVLPKFR
jgi:alkanesulfonate monooxygenase SsuD/methylene tetrahydromethanopterin reductase-like flavin-dependent oxidoreductase (luciferase family)